MVKDNLKSMVKRRLSLLIKGKVQGVFYRATAARIARRLGLDGFVQNLSDGRVRIVAEGSEKKLERLKDWAGKGTKYAQVESIKLKYSESTKEFGSFEVRH